MIEYILRNYGITTCEKNWRVDAKCNDYYMLYYIYGGCATFQNSETTFQLKHGCLYVFPRDKKFSIFHNPKDPLKVVWIHCYFLFPYDISVTEIPIEKDGFLYHLIACLAKSVKNPNPTVDKLFAILINDIKDKIGFNLFIRAEIIEVIRYITGNLKGDLSVKALASVAGYSEKYFYRLFFHNIGISPHQYISKLRFNHAVKLLMEGKSLECVAAQIGYDNKNNFSRDFKKLYKLSPTLYVNKFKEVTF